MLLVSSCNPRGYPSVHDHQQRLTSASRMDSRSAFLNPRQESVPNDQQSCRDRTHAGGRFREDRGLAVCSRK